MYLRIEMDTNKGNILFDTNDKTIKTVKDKDEGYYIYRENFKVYNAITNEIVAKITGTFLDEERCLNDEMDLYYISDIIDQESADAFSALLDDERYKYVSDDISWRPLLTCYLDTFYVMPEYRGKGIGTYLLSNLPDIFNVYLNRYIHAIVTYPKPLPLSGETITEKEESEMLLKMKRHLKRAGYAEIGKSNFYIQNFATKSDYEREREMEYGKT